MHGSLRLIWGSKFIPIRVLQFSNDTFSTVKVKSIPTRSSRYPEIVKR